jgi:hypothetical protein
MGISALPFYRSYEELQQHPPTENWMLLDEESNRLDHHAIARDNRDAAALLPLFPPAPTVGCLWVCKRLKRCCAADDWMLCW